MRLLSKLRRRKAHQDLQALSAAAQLPEAPFADEAPDPADQGAPASDDSGYGSADSASSPVSTPTELSTSEREDPHGKNFAQPADVDRDVVHRRRRETIRFELFGTEDDEDAGAENIQVVARPLQRPRLGIRTSEIVRPPPAATTPVFVDSPQSPHYRVPPVCTPRSSTYPSYERRYHTAASQRLLDITHGRIAASRRRAESFPGFVSSGDHPTGALLAPSSTYAPAMVRESRISCAKDQLRVRLARSGLLVKLRNGVTPAEAAELYLASSGLASTTTPKPPSYSVATSAGPPLSGSAQITSPPHPLALVLPRLPVWAHRPTYGQRCVVSSAKSEGLDDDEVHARWQGVRPGCAAISSRVATIVAELAEHERLRIGPAPPPPLDVPSSDALFPLGLPCGATYGIAAVPGEQAFVQAASPAPPFATTVPTRASASVAGATPPARSRRVRLPREGYFSRHGGKTEEPEEDGGGDDDDERPLATLRRSTWVLAVTPRQQLEYEILNAHVSVPFWLPPLASVTHPHGIAWRPLCATGTPAVSRPRRGAIVAVPPEVNAELDGGNTAGEPEPAARVAPTVVVCSPVPARRFANKPAPASQYWSASVHPASTAKPTSFPVPARPREMPIAARKPEVRSRHSSVELHGSFKVIEPEPDCRLASKSKRWTDGVSLRKARSFWHAVPDTRSACCA